jgi:eukaryotic-like serine/threonine-protein kinase
MMRDREDAPASIGQTLLERYQIERDAGRTDTGIVLDAVELRTNRSVAIEIESDLDDDDERTKLVRDAMIAQRLEGEHVLHVLDAGTLTDGVPYVVREQTISSLARESAARGPIPTPEAVGWTLDVCEALAEAHALGMAHGDVSVDNIFLARGPQSGQLIAKLRWTSKTKAGHIEVEDVAHDIAGLAELLRVLLTGQRDPNDDGAKTLPTDLAYAIGRGLSPDVDARFRNVGELAIAISRFAPPGHTGARNVSFLLARSGIIGFASGRDTPPVSERLSDQWFDVAPEPESAPDTIRDRVVERPPPKRSGHFAMVSLLLLAAVVGGTVVGFRTGLLPRWTGTAESSHLMPDDPVSTTTVTNAEVDVAETTSMTPPSALEEHAKSTEAPAVPAVMETAPALAGPALQNDPTPPAGANTNGDPFVNGPVAPPATSATSTRGTEETPPAAESTSPPELPPARALPEPPPQNIPSPAPDPAP